MAARKKQEEVQAPTGAQVAAEMLTRIDAVSNAEKSGKQAVDDARANLFTMHVDALVALGLTIVTKVAPFIDGAVNGKNVAAVFSKDGALGKDMDADDRAKLKSATTYIRAIRAYQYDSPEARALFIDGPKLLVARCKALAGIDGNAPSSSGYHDWLGAMNADDIARVKALDSDFLATFDFYRDDASGAVIYAKRKSGVGTTDIVKLKKSDNPMVTRVIGADRAALVALVDAAPFDLNISAAKLEAYAEYVLARFRLSTMDAGAEPENVAPPTKQTITV